MAGDRLLLLTDGLYEVEGRDGEQYGKERVLRSATKHAALPLADLVVSLVNDADAFATDADFEDDVCVVGIGIEQLGREDRDSAR
jgi:sigma-B regulation protein RsbU (phosphoserine phosphatase)